MLVSYVSMRLIYVEMRVTSHGDITILHVYILINLHVDINKSHLKIIILHVDIINSHAGDRNIFISKLKLTIYQLTIKNKA